MRDRKPDETDDGPRIQEIINEAATTNADIEIPAGTYELAEPLQLFNVQHISGSE